MAHTPSPRAQMPIQPPDKEAEEMEAEGDSAAEMNGEADESEEERSGSQTESEEESSGEPLPCGAHTCPSAAAALTGLSLRDGRRGL